MTTTFYYTRDTSRGTESLVVAGQVVKTVPSSHPNFIRIRDYCFEQDRVGGEIEMDTILDLYDAEKYIGNELLRVSDRVSFKGGKLLWDGEPTESALASHIVRMIKNRDDNYVAFAKFMENLAQNPSEASRAALFEWIAERDWTITEEGHFVGYKGVTSDFRSLHYGYGIVNGVEMTDYLPNNVGNVVEVPRNKVDEDRESACSYGLHVGTRSFAQDYSRNGYMVIVSVNPRDVVMVPRDGGGQKMRVCRYVVLAENTEELTTTTYRGEHRADEDEDGFYDDRCEECDCLLEDGECTCASCVDEADDNGVCIECGVDLNDDGECSDDCGHEVSYCDTCGEETEEPTEECDDCIAEDENARREEEEAETEDERFNRPTPYGICQWDGAPLDANGACTSSIGRVLKKLGVDI